MRNLPLYSGGRFFLAGSMDNNIYQLATRHGTGIVVEPVFVQPIRETRIANVVRARVVWSQHESLPAGRTFYLNKKQLCFPSAFPTLHSNPKEWVEKMNAITANQRVLIAEVKRELGDYGQNKLWNIVEARRKQALPERFKKDMIFEGPAKDLEKLEIIDVARTIISVRKPNKRIAFYTPDELKKFMEENGYTMLMDGSMYQKIVRGIKKLLSPFMGDFVVDMVVDTIDDLLLK